MKKLTICGGFVGFVKLAVLTVMLGSTFSLQAHAFDAAPDCLDDNNSVLPEMDAQVLVWKKTTANQFLARAHVAGIVKEVYPNMNGHNHFSIKLGTGDTETLEVIYSIDFGNLPTIQPGMQVEACGDYITSTKQTGSYRASPDGAIIHWIHQSNSRKHKSGYVSVNGVVYGQLGGAHTNAGNSDEASGNNTSNSNNNRNNNNRGNNRGSNNHGGRRH